MSMSNKIYFLNRLNIVVHAYNDFKNAMNEYEDLIYDYIIIEESSYMLQREKILKDVVNKGFSLIKSVDRLIEIVYDD